MDRSILYALERLGCDSLTLKDEQTACVKAIYKGKDVFRRTNSLRQDFSGCLQVLASLMCYEVLPFVFDDKLGRRDRTTSY